MCNSCGCSHGELRIEGVVANETLNGTSNHHKHADHEHRAHDHSSHDHSSHDHSSHDHSSHDHSSHDHSSHEHDHSELSHSSHEHNRSEYSGERHLNSAPHQSDYYDPAEARGPNDANDTDNVHYGKGPAHAHAPGLSQKRMVQIEEDIFSKNNQYAARNRYQFLAENILTLNLVSSPGSGKTTLLTETLTRVSKSIDCAVIEGDQETANDAERIRETGVQAIQINTGKGCHLDAHMVGHALEKLEFSEQGVLFIENVGNLVCPASFDLGEAHKVAILSVTEGEDKPIKYPDMFHAADVLLLNKTDLLPYVDFDVDKCIGYAKKVNPNIDVILCSATTGEGIDQWLQWLETKRQQMIQAVTEPLTERIAQLDKIQSISLLSVNPS